MYSPDREGEEKEGGGRRRKAEEEEEEYGRTRGRGAGMLPQMNHSEEAMLCDISVFNLVFCLDFCLSVWRESILWISCYCYLQ